MTITGDHAKGDSTTTIQPHFQAVGTCHPEQLQRKCEKTLVKWVDDDAYYLQLISSFLRERASPEGAIVVDVGGNHVRCGRFELETFALRGCCLPDANVPRPILGARRASTRHTLQSSGITSTTSSHSRRCARALAWPWSQTT